MFDLTLIWLSHLKVISDLNLQNVARPTTENRFCPTNFGFVQLRQFLSKICLSNKDFKVCKFKFYLSDDVMEQSNVYHVGHTNTT